MNLTKRLLVNGRPLALDSDYVRLRLNHSGEGIFEVREAPARLDRALVELYAGVGEGEAAYLVFTGALTESRETAPGRLRLTARELSLSLERTLVLNLSHCTVRQIVARIERETGLRFLLPAGAHYLDERHIRFNHYGSCAAALVHMAKRWELPEMVWFQLPDGRMYWGHWMQGPYTAAPVPIEHRLILERDEKAQTLLLPYIPALRPGMLVDAGFRFRVDGLTFAGETVRVKWSRA